MLEDPNPNYYGIRLHVHRKTINIKRCDDTLLLHRLREECFRMFVLFFIDRITLSN